MKRLLTATILVAAILSMALTGCAPKPITLRLGETHPQDYPTTKGDYEFARLVKERSNGRITVEIFHSKQLGEEKAVIEQVQLGAIDITRVSVSVTAAFIPELDALQLPYLYRDADHMWNVLNGEIGDELFKAAENKNFVGLCWFDGGTRNFYTKKPVKAVTDLKGMKIRVQQSPLMVGMVEGLGAVATPMNYGEVYAALQSGIVDGAENNWPSYLTTSHCEVARYFIVDEHTRVPEIMIGSKKVFDKLSKADRDLILKAAKDSVPVQIKLWTDYEKEAEKAVTEKGSVITYPSAEVKQAFMDAMNPLYAKQPQNVLDLVTRIRAVQ